MDPELQKQSEEEKKKETADFSLSNFRVYYKATAIKTAWNWHKNTWLNGAEQGQFITDKGGMNVQSSKCSLFNRLSLESWTATCQRMKLEHFPMPYIIINPYILSLQY